MQQQGHNSTIIIIIYVYLPELIVGSLSVCLIVCVSGHFTTLLHLPTLLKRKRN